MVKDSLMGTRWSSTRGSQINWVTIPSFVFGILRKARSSKAVSHTERILSKLGLGQGSVNPLQEVILKLRRQVDIPPKYK